jgi:hypothetical protein
MDRHSAERTRAFRKGVLRRMQESADHQGISASSRVSPIRLTLSSGERCRKTKGAEAHTTAWRDPVRGARQLPGCVPPCSVAPEGEPLRR